MMPGGENWRGLTGSAAVPSGCLLIRGWQGKLALGMRRGVGGGKAGGGAWASCLKAGLHPARDLPAAFSGSRRSLGEACHNLRVVSLQCLQCSLC